MSVAPNEKRSFERVSLSLTAVVKAKQDRETFWSQNTELISISRSGAGFYLERKCEVGQLVSLMMPMPKHIRCYDFDKELYRVWGLVQHCSPLPGEGDAGFHVGVAFVGKNSPASYAENPLQSYRIAGMNEDGTWKIIEAKTSFVVRRHPRYWASLEIVLAAQDDQRTLITDEMAVTENVSMSGAAVYSTLNVNIGDSVNFDCVPYNFSAMAIVRNRQTDESELPKLHLEFVNAVFPVERVTLPQEQAAEKEKALSATAERASSIEETVRV